MKRIRIGNDIHVRWTILDQFKRPYDLTGKSLTVNVGIGPVLFNISDFTVEDDNVLCFTFYGKDQKLTGPYILYLVENKGEVNMKSIDTNKGFILVPHSWQSVNDDVIDEECTVDLTGTLNLSNDDYYTKSEVDDKIKEFAALPVIDLTGRYSETSLYNFDSEDWKNFLNENFEMPVFNKEYTVLLGGEEGKPSCEALIHFYEDDNLVEVYVGYPQQDYIDFEYIMEWDEESHAYVDDVTALDKKTFAEFVKWSLGSNVYMDKPENDNGLVWYGQWSTSQVKVNPDYSSLPARPTDNRKYFLLVDWSDKNDLRHYNRKIYISDANSVSGWSSRMDFVKFVQTKFRNWSGLTPSVPLLDKIFEVEGAKVFINNYPEYYDDFLYHIYQNNLQAFEDWYRDTLPNIETMHTLSLSGTTVDEAVENSLGIVSLYKRDHNEYYPVATFTITYNSAYLNRIFIDFVHAPAHTSSSTNGITVFPLSIVLYRNVDDLEPLTLESYSYKDANTGDIIKVDAINNYKYINDVLQVTDISGQDLHEMLNSSNLSTDPTFAKLALLINCVKGGGMFVNGGFKFITPDKYTFNVTQMVYVPGSETYVFTETSGGFYSDEGVESFVLKPSGYYLHINYAENWASPFSGGMNLHHMFLIFKNHDSTWYNQLKTIISKYGSDTAGINRIIKFSDGFMVVNGNTTNGYYLEFSPYIQDNNNSAMLYRTAFFDWSNINNCRFTSAVEALTL